ncbi:PDZ domain [Plasmopara halstedii]|uniref:PDZ domain n=1 Tax=Plasmopara halstedii TaxID=4781 RepID=A0A0P1AB06_PLAHL|nr:PDZ domain [Plasmopara halstedii]CEG37585.1 PDZ domain [Plasmopara halstedii]|eukprot:XP_024573954.1 PDZ domain [Plasmopara halstedii]
MAATTDALQTAQTGVEVRLDERKMYVAEWADGAAFGFTVTPVQSDRGTVLCLARRTSSTGLQDVVPGDMLIAIGDTKVYHLGAGNATKLLRSVQKPIHLTLQVSPYNDTAKDLPNLAPNEYTYLWESGPLGIVLTTDPKSKLPLVKRFTGKIENETLERDVSVGDELVYVNETPTSDHSISAIITFIKELPKPITLRFRKPLAELHMELPELKEGEYDFLWEYGSLGLVVGTSAEGLPFVRSFTGKGTSKQLSQVQENDEIILVNNRAAQEYGFHETMQYIMNVPKPAVIRFRRPLANRIKVDTSQEIVSRSSMPNAQMAALSVTASPPPMRSMSAASGSPSVQKYSVNSTDQEATNGLLGYRSGRSQSSISTLRRQQSSKLQFSGSEDLTNSQVVSNHQVEDQGYSLPPQSVPQPQQMQHSSLQQSYQEPSSSFHTDVEYFEIDSNAYYQIQWTDGPFGLTVREAQSKQGPLVLITKRTGKATCAGLRRVAVGDILIKIGDQDVRELGFERSTLYLRNVPKPIVLTFQAID